MGTNIMGTNIMGTNIMGTNIMGTNIMGTNTTTINSYADHSVYYTKENVSLKEYKIHAYVYDLHIVNIPKIIHYNKKTKQMIMVRVGEMNVADFYGSLAEDISADLFARIRMIIQTLYEHNILYIDITGYNFIENEGKIWIIDFEHTRYNPKRKNKFVERFLGGANEWNPDFL